MKPSATKSTPREIAELLESDDELPDSYDEIPDIPAYQNDNRFERLESIKFEWLHQKHKNDSTQAELPNQQSYLKAKTYAANEVFAKQQSFSKEQFAVNKSFPEQTTEVTKDKKMILISKGIMTKRNIFFIKSIEEYSTDTTLLWFIDFLNNKAEQPFQRGCLVGDITEDRSNATKDPFSDFNMRYYFKLVVS